MKRGFTIVEIVIVVAVIGILAAVSIIGYGAFSRNAAENTMKSDLKGTAASLESYRNFNNDYPATLGNGERVQSKDNTVTYIKRTTGYCIEVTSTKSTNRFYKTEGGEGEGACPPPAAMALQMVTNASCPTQRTLAYDARDNHSYWIQKLADGRCWTLTNLMYTGAGTNTYGDVKAITDGAGHSTYSPSTPVYYFVNAISYPKRPNAPSTSTDGGDTGEQYGQLYNWCAATGGQGAVCQDDGTPVNTTISICPAGWRLPQRSEFQGLTTAIGATNTVAGSQALRTVWLAQYGGHWGYNGWLTEYEEQGASGHFWSSTETYPGSITHVEALEFSHTSVTAGGTGGVMMDAALSVRCTAV